MKQAMAATRRRRWSSMAGSLQGEPRIPRRKTAPCRAEDGLTYCRDMRRPAAKKTAEVEAFCRAVWRRDATTIAALVSRVDPNGVDRWGYTPLSMAAQYGDLALVSS